MTARRIAGLTVALVATVGAGLGTYAMAAGNTRERYAWDLPARFPTPRVPASNPMSTAKVQLGRRLFFDPRLSGNQTQSCASCHRPELAFTDGRTTSVGSTGQAHPRNAQSLVNVAYAPTLTWANPSLVTLERQMEVPLFGTFPVELGVTDRNRGEVVGRIRRDPVYRRLFRRAFGGRAISLTAIVRAIAAFERSIISADSTYDRYLAGRAKLTPEQTRGMNLFMGERGDCAHCHGSFLFNDQVSYVGAEAVRPAFHNTGLYNLGGTGAFPAPNRGVFEITGRKADMGAFKAPSLRNVALTAPYMHDGSIPTLEAAVAHYVAGGRNITDGPFAGDGRANPYKDPLITPRALSAQEQSDLVAFLRTLTDLTLPTSRRFADPFGGRPPRAVRRSPEDPAG